MQLLEYTFYMEEPEEGDVENLLLGGELNEQDPVTDEEEVAVEDPFAADEEVEGDESIEMDVTADEEVEGEEVDVDPFGGDDAMEVEDEFIDTGAETSVEVDVTDIVDKAEATQEEIASLTSKMDELLGKLGDLENQVSGMDQVITKIDDLEKEIEVRNPTPVEKLEMRSMDSFPYSVSLTDFWADQEGYDTSGEEEEEYVITQKDVDEYSETDIKQSFSYKADDDED